MELKILGKKLITEPIKSTITQGETGADTFKITLSRYYDGKDLANYSFKMRGIFSDETLAEQVLVAAVDGEKITLKWCVTSDFTAISGKLSLVLVAVSPENSEIVKFMAQDIFVNKSLLGNFLPPANVIEQALAQMQTSVATALDYANQAKSCVGKSAYQIWLDAGNSGGVNDFLQAIRGETISVNGVNSANGNVSLSLDDLPDGQLRKLSAGGGGGGGGGADEFRVALIEKILDTNFSKNPFTMLFSDVSNIAYIGNLNAANRLEC